jgi:Cu(I)/Ag(I) efflux system membrane protein CusA/SilA
MKSLFAWILKNRLIIYLLFFIVAAAGIWSLRTVPVDAIPDIGENQVIVFADWAGRSPKDVEDQVTYPLSTALQGIAGVKEIRGQSGFGFSMIYVIFDDSVDFYFARTRVLEKLGYAASSLPAGVTPTLGPDANGLGQIYWYTLEGGGLGLQELRSLQDWYVKYALGSVQGVSEVASLGGYVKQYQVDLDPRKMYSYNLRISDIMMALRNGNLDVGAKVLEQNGMEFLIRGVGFVKNVTDIGNIVVGMNAGGTPIRVQDVASVTMGPEFRRGVMDKNGEEAVGGVVIARYRENPAAVIARVKEKIRSVEKGLPPGVKIVPFYDRSDLIQETTGTLKESLIVEITITIAVILVFMLPFTLSLLISLTLPLSVLFSFLLMRLFHVDAHIMSLSGIIIAIGTIVDMGIVVTENIFRHLEHTGEANLKPGEDETLVRDGAAEVAVSVISAISTIVMPFLAILALEGQSAKLFHPVVFTKTFALFGSLLTAVLLLPALFLEMLRLKRTRFFRAIQGFLSSRKLKLLAGAGILAGLAILAERLTAFFKPGESGLFREIHYWISTNAFMLIFSAVFLALLFFLAKNAQKIIRTIIPWGFRHRAILLVPLVVFLAAIGLLVFRIQNEFKPKLDEGSFLFMPVLLPSASLSQVKEVLQTQDEILKNYPEVESAVGKLGRMESATDPADITMIETIVNLKPKREWRKGMTMEKMRAELDEKLKIPGVGNIWTQPIQNRIDMLSTGIRTPVGVKIFGPDLKVIEELGLQVERAVKKVPGYEDSYAERIIGKPYIEYQINREAIARYGMSIADVQDVIMNAIGGENVTTTVEGRERYPVRLRYQRDYRESFEALSNVLVVGPQGQKVPISALADIRVTMGPAMINSENGVLRGIVYLNLKEGAGAVEFVKAAGKVIDREVSFPNGYYYSFAGDFLNQVRAFKRLRFVIPLVILLIFLILYFNFQSVYQTLIVFTAVPISLSGGILLLGLMGYKMSVAVVVGFVALFGIAVNDGILLTNYINQLRVGMGFRSVEEIRDTILHAALQRIRPLLMTTATAMLSLVPILWSSGRGSEMIRPMSIPTIGGLLMVIITIFIVPLLNSWIMESRLKKGLDL